MCSTRKCLPLRVSDKYWLTHPKIPNTPNIRKLITRHGALEIADSKHLSSPIMLPSPGLRPMTDQVVRRSLEEELSLIVNQDWWNPRDPSDPDAPIGRAEPNLDSDWLALGARQRCGTLQRTQERRTRLNIWEQKNQHKTREQKHLTFVARWGTTKENVLWGSLKNRVTIHILSNIANLVMLIVMNKGRTHAARFRNDSDFLSLKQWKEVKLRRIFAALSFRVWESLLLSVPVTVPAQSDGGCQPGGWPFSIKVRNDNQLTWNIC